MLNRREVLKGMVGAAASTLVPKLFSPNWRDLATPAIFANTVTNGQWTMARHLALLDKAIIETLFGSGGCRRLIVTMPPRHGKSELCSKYLPAWFVGCWPNKRVILASYEADFAAEWGRKARTLLEDHGGLFGVEVNQASRAADRWDILGYEGGMRTAGVSGPITGKGANLLIVDDPIKNAEEAVSGVYREKTWQWWQSTAYTRLEPDGAALVIQTRWHREDLTGQLLNLMEAEGEKWRVINLPALAEDDDPLEREPGAPLWPERFPLEELQRIQRNVGPHVWSALYQQKPRAEGLCEWPDEYFGPQVWFEEWPKDFDVKVISLDPSKGKDAKAGDYSCFWKIGVKNGTAYCEAFTGRWNSDILADMAVELIRDFGPDSFACEVNQFQELLADNIQKKAEARGMFFAVSKLDNRLNKRVRIRRLTPHLSQGQIRFKAGSASTKLAVDQHRDFPNGEYDDGPDSLEMGIRDAKRLLHGVEPEPEYV